MRGRNESKHFKRRPRPRQQATIILHCIRRRILGRPSHLDHCQLQSVGDGDLVVRTLLRQQLRHSPAAPLDIKSGTPHISWRARPKFRTILRLLQALDLMQEGAYLTVFSATGKANLARCKIGSPEFLWMGKLGGTVGSSYENWSSLKVLILTEKTNA